MNCVVRIQVVYELVFDHDRRAYVRIGVLCIKRGWLPVFYSSSFDITAKIRLGTNMTRMSITIHTSSEKRPQFYEV